MWLLDCTYAFICIVLNDQQQSNGLSSKSLSAIPSVLNGFIALQGRGSQGDPLHSRLLWAHSAQPALSLSHVFPQCLMGSLPCRVEAVRVTHSIPDCCGLILRSEHGNIVHTGDWKIEEDPVDGQHFDRTVFEQIGKLCMRYLRSLPSPFFPPGPLSPPPFPPRQQFLSLSEPSKRSTIADWLQSPAASL